MEARAADELLTLLYIYKPAGKSAVISRSLRSVNNPKENYTFSSSHAGKFLIRFIMGKVTSPHDIIENDIIFLQKKCLLYSSNLMNSPLVCFYLH